MRIEFDPTKNATYARLRGLPFEDAGRFEFETALVYVDERKDYGETRFVALGYFDARLHVLCFTEVESGSACSASARPTPARYDGMSKSKSLIDERGEVREIQARDLRSFRRAQDALPASLRKKVGVRGPQKEPTKERVTIRLSRDVVGRFRATGDGWQRRVDAALQDWLEKHEPA